MWGYTGDGAWGWGILGMAHMVLWWILLVFGIILLSKWLFAGLPGNGRASRKRALEILEQRYERGEIERNEFESKRRDLDG